MRERKYEISARRINDCIESLDIKKTDLADKIDVDRSAITHYTNGTACPRHDTAVKMGDIFGVNPLWLMNLSDDKYALTDEEQLLIETYRTSDEETKAMVERLLKYNELLKKGE